ncbi:acyloxyacyl hydrolase [Alteromonas sediminis]|uniref:Lipid A deacylase n=1 Tax=Alteromonas sediminis TaxID=2259342 RepID=A0A3N5Z7C7_9ALTE|nr:acyloxyacyl hydrolase [Alteromonas sediminis]RPJ66564.1 acyloxyacyl hydrolase [Alteromonas sediminis]
MSNFKQRTFDYLIRLIKILLILSMQIVQLHARELSIDYLRGEGDVEGIKLAYRHNAFQLDKASPNLAVYVESSVNFWKYGSPEHYDSNFVVSLSPILQYTLCRCTHGEIYAEAGIGISLLDDTQFAGKNVSTHYQFEDRLGIGYRFGEQLSHSLALRYFHYSNAGFKRPNPGLDFISFSYSKAY